MSTKESEHLGVLVSKIRLRVKTGEIEVTAKIRAKGGFRNRVLWTLDTKDRQEFDEELGVVGIYFSPEKR